MRVPGTGPVPCELFFCGEFPGVQESREGEPFVGRTSKDFMNHLLPSLGLRREDVYLTNLYREYRPEGQSEPYTKEEFAADLEELRAELAAVEPRLIVPIGAAATRYFLDPDADLDEVHGILWTKDDRLIFPVTHVAAYTPELQSRVAYDFQQLHHAMYDDGVEPRVLWQDNYPNPTYIEVNDAKWIRGALHGVRTVHIDTEGHPFNVWSLQFAVQPGTAYLIRMASRECLQAFLDWVLSERPRVVFHGSLHDFGILRAMFQVLGLSFEALYDVEFDDTQIMAYLLQLEPIGLKPNCVRHCNMRMQDYTEVLGDAQMILAQDYLVKIFDIEQARYRQRQQEEFNAINETPLRDDAGNIKRTKEGRIRFRHTTVLPKLPRTDLHKAAERVLRSSRPYALWQDQREDIKVAAYNLEVV